jgi:hypothetical protein
MSLSRRLTCAFAHAQRVSERERRESESERAREWEMRGGGVRLSGAESIGCGIDSRADDKGTVIQVANSLFICTLLDYTSRINNERITKVIRFSCLVSPTAKAFFNKSSQCYCSSVRSAASWLCCWGAFSILCCSSRCMACSAAYSSSASRNSSASRASISLCVSVL